MRDREIRVLLHDALRIEHAAEPDTRFVNELGLCRGDARIDLAVVNGHLHGYEIKSERDTLDRLPSQAQTYCKVFDFLTVVVAPSHLTGVRKLVPRSWGITVTQERKHGPSLRPVRRARRNGGTSPLALAQLLWRDEALAALVVAGFGHGLKGKPKKVLWQKLTESFNRERLAEHVRACLKSREGWRSVS